MRKLFIGLISENGYVHFVIIVMIYFAISYITNECIVTDSFMYNSLYGQIPDKYIEESINFQKKWEWIWYILQPVILLIKWTFITSFIAIGSVFMGYQISLKTFYKIVMSCEWLFIFFGIINFVILFLSNVTSMQGIEELNFVNRLSIGYFFRDINKLEWLSKPLYTLNIVNLIYILLIAFAIGVVSSQKYYRNLLLVIRCYIPVLITWVILLTYITITYA